MEHFTQNELQRFSECLQALYTVCSIEDFSSQLLLSTSKVLPAVDYTYSTLAFGQHKATLVSYQPGIGVDPLNTAEFERIAYEHFHENPLVGNYIRTQDCRAHRVSEFLDEQQLQRLEGMYWKLMQPRGLRDVIAVVILTALTPNPMVKRYYGQGDVTTVTLFGDRVFTERDRLIFNVLRPHLLQAQQNAQQFAHLQQDWLQQSSRLEALGVIALNGEGQVQFMSERAWQWLTQYFQDSSASTQHLPDHLQRWVKHQLSLPKSDAIAPPHLPLKLEQDGRQLSVRFVTEQPGEQYLLLLEEQQSVTLSPTTLELLGLTKREAEVLFQVMQGKTNPEIATTLGISVGTVRKYLEQIYAKLAVQSRAEAIVYALRQLGALNH